MGNGDGGSVGDSRWLITLYVDWTWGLLVSLCFPCMQFIVYWCWYYCVLCLSFVCRYVSKDSQHLRWEVVRRWCTKVWVLWSGDDVSPGWHCASANWTSACSHWETVRWRLWIWHRSCRLQWRWVSCAEFIEGFLIISLFVIIIIIIVVYNVYGQVPRQFNACQASGLHWMPVTHRIICKMAMVVIWGLAHCNTSLHQLSPPHKTHICVASGTLVLDQPSRRSDLARHGVCHMAPAVWNSLPGTVLGSPSLTVYKSA